MFQVSLRAHKCSQDEASLSGACPPADGDQLQLPADGPPRPPVATGPPADSEHLVTAATGGRQLQLPQDTAVGTRPPDTNCGQQPDTNCIQLPDTHRGQLPDTNCIQLPDTSCENLPDMIGQISDTSPGISGHLPGTSAGHLSDTAGAQLPFRPKVSRVLLRRLVHKLRARRERTDSLPPATATSGPERQGGAGHPGSSVRQRAPDGAAGSSTLDQLGGLGTAGSVLPCLATPDTYERLDNADRAILDSTASDVPGSMFYTGSTDPVMLDNMLPAVPGSTIPTAVHNTDSMGVCGTFVAEPGSMIPVALGPAAPAALVGSDPVRLGPVDTVGLQGVSVDVLSGAEGRGSGAPLEPELDLQQLLQFPLPELPRRPPLSPLHRAIENVARELANIPLHSPPASAASPPGPAPPLEPPDPPPAEEPADLELLLSRLFE